MVSLFIQPPPRLDPMPLPKIRKTSLNQWLYHLTYWDHTKRSISISRGWQCENRFNKLFSRAHYHPHHQWNDLDFRCCAQSSELALALNGQALWKPKRCTLTTILFDLGSDTGDADLILKSLMMSNFAFTNLKFSWLAMKTFIAGWFQEKHRDGQFFKTYSNFEADIRFLYNRSLLLIRKPGGPHVPIEKEAGASGRAFHRIRVRNDWLECLRWCVSLELIIDGIQCPVATAFKWDDDWFPQRVSLWRFRPINGDNCLTDGARMVNQ